jgi:FMN-dependent NADH-azoreductase
MVKVLWVEGSPKGDRSLSTVCARGFLTAASAVVPDLEVTHRDVWDGSILRFDREAALAKFGPLFGEPHTDVQSDIWRQVTAEIDQVAAHDHVVVSSPMWNWSIPHALKAWIDVIVQPLHSFTLNAAGEHVGVLGVGKMAQFVLTRSSAYDGRHPEMQDHQEPYLRYLFNLLGFDVRDSLVIEPTTRWTTEERAALAEQGVADATEAGTRFGIDLATRAEAADS